MAKALVLWNKYADDVYVVGGMIVGCIAMGVIIIGVGYGLWQTL